MVQQHLKGLLDIASKDNVSTYSGKLPPPKIDIEVISLNPFITEYTNKQSPTHREALGDMTQQEINTRLGKLLYSIFTTLLQDGNDCFIKRIRMEFHDFNQ